MKKVAVVTMCFALLTGVASAAQSSGSSKMTNADVIQLIAAGLSDQVIIGAIRQASEKDFDLTAAGLIALKKAGVPDPVILFMQSLDMGPKGGPSRSPADDREAAVNFYLQQRVTSESRGALTLSRFQKTNGYEQELTKLYVLEWQAEILFQHEGWKPGDFIGGYWNDFGVMPSQAAFLGGSWLHFQRGAKIRLKGECMLRKTEQGWRIEGLTVKTTQVLVESGPTEPMPSVTDSPVDGKYVRKGRSSDFLQLKRGKFSILQNGHKLDGTYTVEGDTLILTSPRMSVPAKGHVIGETITDEDGIVWEKLAELEKPPS